MAAQSLATPNHDAPSKSVWTQYGRGNFNFRSFKQEFRVTVNFLLFICKQKDLICSVHVIAVVARVKKERG
jgi:hypothetical protein